MSTREQSCSCTAACPVSCSCSPCMSLRSSLMLTTSSRASIPHTRTCICKGQERCLESGSWLHSWCCLSFNFSDLWTRLMPKELTATSERSANCLMYRHMCAGLPQIIFDIKTPGTPHLSRLTTARRSRKAAT